MSTDNDILSIVESIDKQNEQGWSNVRHDPIKVVNDAQSILRDAESIDYVEGKAHALLNMGAGKLWSADYEAAIERTMEALRLFNDLDMYKSVAQCHYNIGTVFFYLSDYENALQSYIESLKNYEKAGNEIGKADALNGIGSVYYTIEENQKALHYLNQSLTICQENKAYHIQQKVLDGLGKTYSNLEEFDHARSSLFDCIDIIKKHNGSDHVLAHALNNLGNVSFKEHKHEDALEYYDQSLELRKKIGFHNGIAECLNNISKVHIDQGALSEAELKLKKAHEIGEQINSNDILVGASKLFSIVYEKKKDTANALHYFKKFHELSEKVKNEKSDRRNKSIELKFKIEQEEQEKQMLSSQNQSLKKYSEDLVRMSEIGKSLMSLHSAEEIIEKSHEEVNKIMDASSFGMGIYDAAKQSLNFPVYLEENEPSESIVCDLKDEKKLAPICFQEQKEIIISDFKKEFSQWLDGKTAPLTGKATQSIIYIPFESPNGSTGVLTAQSFKKNAYKEHHINMLRNLSVYMAIALDNALLYQNLEAKVHERTQELEKKKEDIEQSFKVTSLLTEVGRQLTSSTDFNSIFLKLHQSVSQLMDAECFGVRLYRPDKNEIEYKFEIENGVVDDESFSVSMENDDNYSVICVKNKQVIFINDNLNEYQKYTKEIIVPSGEMPHSLIFYPMTIGEKVIGLITVQSFKKFAYTEKHKEILNTLSSFTAIALENVHIMENLEEEVNSRTHEVVEQKEKIEKTYQNTQLLNEIGREITSSLSITDVLEKVYENINELFDAAVVGVGILNEEGTEVELKGVIENGKKLPDFSYSMDDKNSLAVYCIAKQEEIFINDTENEIKKYIKDDITTKAGELPNSILYIPLKIKEKVIGLISVQSFEKFAYGDYELNILRNLALYAATAIENAGLYAEMEQKVLERTKEVVQQKEEIETTYNNIRLLSQIGQDIISTHDLETIFEKLQENVNQLMDATIFSIRICDYEKNTVDYTYTIENGKRLDQHKISLDDIENYTVWCVKNKKDVFITDHQKDYKKYTDNIKVVDGDLPESLIFCPMIVKGKVIGAVTAQSFNKHAYTHYHLDILRTLGTYTAIALENANLINNMENEVKSRTLEVVEQKEEIERNLENTKLLSEISKEIASELSTDQIIKKVYKNLNNLMDATIFGIGRFREEKDDLLFSGAMEKGEKLNDFSYSINDKKIATNCFLNIEEIVINDWAKEFKKYVKEDYETVEGEMPESMIYLPLVSKGNPIGVLTVQSFEKSSYTSYHLNILRSLAVTIASALENASLYQDMEKRVEERTREIQTAYQNTKLLSQIGKDIVESLEIESIIERVYKNINSLMDATSFGIGLYEEEEKRVKMPGFIENGKRLEDFYYNLNDDRLGVWCFKNKKDVFIADYSKEYKKYIKSDQAPVSGKETNSIIYIPLFLKEKIIGLMTVQSYKKNAYSEYHFDILKGMSNTIATALENARLYENMEEKVRQRTAEVVSQKEIIEEKNKDITDSIKYAKRIQNVMLPPIEEFKSHFQNSFIMFKPRDIVSGDFYWLEKIGDKIYFSVVDCTGHGVPGALVSVVGANGLNRCINELKLRQPAEILNKLSEIVTKTFEKTESDIKDGMDMALCCIDLKTNQLEYAGANNPLWIIRKSEINDEVKHHKISTYHNLNLIEIKPDKQPIGYYLGAKPFTNHLINLEADDSLYLFSDGFADQFGGNSYEERARGGKKFKYANLKKLVTDIQKLPMDKQLDVFNKRFEEWRGDMEQVDDICVLGVRI